MTISVPLPTSIGAIVTKTTNGGTGTLPGNVSPVSTVTVTGAKSTDPTAPSPVITLLGATAPGPHAVFVHALDSTLGAGTPLTARYTWDFGDPTAQYNTLVGWDAAHAYDTPGTYTITLTLTNELGKTSTLSTQITVEALTHKTIYVDSVLGNDNNDGASPTTAIKTWVKAVTLVKSNTDVLFRAGETFPVDRGMALNYQNVVIGSYGTGNDPILLRGPGYGSSMVSMFNDCSNITVQNLTFDSIWKPVGVHAPKVGADAIFPAGQDISIRGCTFLNLDVAVDEDRNPQGTLVQNCLAPLATGLRGVFIWGQGTDQVYLGNYVANSTREHIIRTVWVVRELIAFNNLTNLDRSKLGDLADYNKGTIDVHRGSYAYVASNYLYDGELRVGPRPDRRPSKATPRNGASSREIICSTINSRFTPARTTS